MNNVYFGCLDCKMYVDAGYRWAYWELEEKGIVNRKDPISAEKVLAADSYWAPYRDAPVEKWGAFFPFVQSFLKEHAPHHLIYGDDYRLYQEDMDDEYWNWMDVSEDARVSPRSLIAQGFETWIQVEEFIRASEWKPWWWDDRGSFEKARDKFEKLASER